MAAACGKWARIVLMVIAMLALFAVRLMTAITIDMTAFDLFG